MQLLRSAGITEGLSATRELHQVPPPQTPIWVGGGGAAGDWGQGLVTPGQCMTPGDPGVAGGQLVGTVVNAV